MNDWTRHILSENFDLKYIFYPVENKPHTSSDQIRNQIQNVSRTARCAVSDIRYEPKINLGYDEKKKRKPKA